MDEVWWEIERLDALDEVHWLPVRGRAAVLKCANYWEADQLASVVCHRRDTTSVRIVMVRSGARVQVGELRTALGCVAR